MTEWVRYFGTTEESMKKTCVKLVQFDEYCKKKFDCTMAQMAVAWCVKFRFTSCVLIGASRLEMLKSNLKALDLVPKIDEVVEKEIEEIFGNKPKQEINYLTWTPMPDRRDRKSVV